MRTKLIFLLFFCCLSDLITAQLSAEKRLRDYVDSFIRDKHLEGVFFSLKLVSLETGETVFEYNPELKMVPASIQKVITTGIGFVNLGEEYTFKTSVFYDGTVGADSVLNGNLYISGGGDPSLGSTNFPETVPETVFNKIACGIKNAGISRISGVIVAEDSYFDGFHSVSETVHPSWEWEDMGSYYGAGVHGLNFCENAFTVKISCKEPDKIAVSSAYPFSEVVMPDVISDIKVIHRDSLPCVTSFSSPIDHRYLIRGEAPEGKEIGVECALQNPSGVFVFWLRNYLRSAGIAVDNRVDFVSGSERYLLTEIMSPSYGEIAKFTNYTSNNLFADAVFKNIAKMGSGEALFSKSAANMTDLLKSINLNTRNIRIVDGSGLSRHNLITAGFMCEYLRRIKQIIPDFHLFLPSPGTGKSTLRYFMSSYSNKSSKERIFLKSGSMTGVMNYAGYVVGKNGDTVCVAIMMNNFICKTRDLRPKIERLVYLISEL
ncbi:MAG: D-alanyl-D-alanine carboxypeptidase/D-alanyl-D-alanine-endopeptidase [Prevotellaceae bacterium]|jgi:D-alanyl-D-alanine carboxypeptidase/D-alanyl-D-alanine-endopeptidase (penicillin-binding protein 4)|nr:D-alanyl-D-alanine carboxypeptidase/D-alanyl-D-alanine-endopeptidase [Prevotellaceae bacterium]